MLSVERGQRLKLEGLAKVDWPLEVSLVVRGPATYDFSCFGVDRENKLSDDRYMVFYNQLRSPQGEISLQLGHNEAKFTVALSSLPPQIEKLVFTVNLDDQLAGHMQQISSQSVTLEQRGVKLAQLELRGSDFQVERAVIALELYLKDGIWRANFVGQGFKGGLAELLKFYGGEEEAEPKNISPQREETPPPSPVGVSKGVSLEKKLAQEVPELAPLARSLGLTLAKRNLDDCLAKVALVMDASGSMYNSYRDGTVQAILNRIFPLALRFDDDGELDFWFFATKAKRMPNVTLQNYRTIIPKRFANLTMALGACNDEIPVLDEVIATYRASKLPAYVVFISDGGISKTKAISNRLLEATSLPIFWQFVGVRGSNYGILEHLESLEGRSIDNTSFFTMDDFATVADNVLYDRLLERFPQWLQEARRQKII